MQSNTLLQGNVKAFDEILSHGGDIHTHPEMGLFPATMASALNDSQFFANINWELIRVSSK